MAFREKSAWIMAAALLLGGVFYFGVVLASWSASGLLLPPLIPLVVLYTVCLIGIALVGHVVIAALKPKEANMPVDEREKGIFFRAGHYSSHLCALGLLASLGLYLVFRNGDLLFYTVFASLMLAQLMEYVLQIVFYRTKS
ncbi:MAG: hypothetical protein AAFY29_07810 [Pseudomonadota bacterium]